MIAPQIFSDKDENLGSAVQSGLRRIRSWRVPPNWSRHDWIEELKAVGTAAACQAVCEFDPARGVPLAGFGYCRMISRCLARYRKEWTYAQHLTASDSSEDGAATYDPTERAFPSPTKINEKNDSNDDLRSAVRTLPLEQRRMIEQLFWEERTESEVAAALGTNQSTVSRRKHAILNRLRMKLRDHKAIVR